MRYIFTLLALALALAAQGQLVLTAGSRWTDATLYKSSKPGSEDKANINYGTYPQLAGIAWSESGSPSFRRSLLKFDLSQIPQGANISSAYLYFFSDPAGNLFASCLSGKYRRTTCKVLF